jgi:hypothetical protein
MLAMLKSVGKPMAFSFVDAPRLAVGVFDLT